MKTLKLLVAATMAVTLLAGCGGSSTDTSTFKFASELDIQGMDSTVNDDGMSFNAMHAITEGLMGINAKGSTINALAKSYKVSTDGKTYTFTLRDDAKWSDGNKVVAGDFVYSWRKIIQNAGNYAYMMGSEGAAIKNADKLIALGTKATDAQMATLGVTAKDDKTLVVQLENKVPYFLDLMTFPCYYPQDEAFVKKCGKKYATDAKYTVSCGAYTMKSWTKGSKAVFTKNKNYYDASTVKTDNLEMYLVQDPKTAATNFDSGKVDYCTINSSLVDKYKSKSTYTSFNEGYLFYLSLNFKNKYLANKNIRAALSYAINRSDFCTSILKDGSKEANGFVPSQLSTSPAGKDFRSDAGDYTSYNVSKAQEYLNKGLKELGKSSISLDLLYGTDESPMDTLAQYLQNAFSKLKGLKINMVATVKKDRIYNRQAKGNFDICCTRWGPDYADPTTYLNLLTSNNANNYGKYSNSAYDALMKKVQTATNLTTRWNYMVQAEKVAMEDYGYIPVFEKGSSALQSSSVSGLVHKAVGVPYTFTYVQKK